MIAVAVFAFSNVSFAFQDTPYAQSLGLGMLTVRTLVDFAGMMLLYAHKENLREVQLRYELESMNNLFQSQYEQYRRYRENDEIIKKQYHDLKHQVAMIRAERDPQKQESYLRQLNESLEIYGTQHKTGNPVVDTMLSGKSMLCREKGIQLLSYADAAPLEFVNAMDLCSIFGNALDNAIECAEKLEDPEKRQIKVYVYTQNQFVIIRFENFYDDALAFRGRFAPHHQEERVAARLRHPQHPRKRPQIRRQRQHPRRGWLLPAPRAFAAQTGKTIAGYAHTPAPAGGSFAHK